jgi:hypothetical protein
MLDDDGPVIFHANSDAKENDISVQYYNSSGNKKP